MHAGQAAPAGRVAISDAEMSRLALHVTSSGVKGWQIRYRPKGNLRGDGLSTR